MKPVLQLDGVEYKVEGIDYLNGEAMVAKIKKDGVSVFISDRKMVGNPTGKDLDKILVFKNRFTDLLEELDTTITEKETLRSYYAFSTARETDKHKKHLLNSSFNKLDYEISGLKYVRDLILRLEGSQ